MASVGAIAAQRPLYPLSQGEIEGRREGFLGAAFADRLPKTPSAPDRTEVARRILRGASPTLTAGPRAVAGGGSRRT